MKIIRPALELRAWTEAYRRASLSVGFVPTLGALHAGHRGLLDAARGECDKVVASIYLNPTQFNARSDLDAYPSTPEDDVAMCEEAGVDLLWLAQRDDLLPDGFQSWVNVEELTHPLCGAGRPGHFRGVATVVTQLLHVVRPHRAYFGLKDYQQSRVVTRMVSDLVEDVEIRYVETVREPDGLAMSSRNARLAAHEREAATVLSRALFAARAAVEAGERSIESLLATLCATIGQEPVVQLEYAEIRDGETLESPVGDVLKVDGAGSVLALAAQVGPVRLIDNVVLIESR